MLSESVIVATLLGAGVISMGCLVALITGALSTRRFHSQSKLLRDLQ